LAFFKEISNLILGNSNLLMLLPKTANVKAVTGPEGWKMTVTKNLKMTFWIYHIEHQLTEELVLNHWMNSSTFVRKTTLRSLNW